MYDPQTGNLKSWKEVSKKIRKRYIHEVLRVDDKLINIELMKGIVKKKEVKNNDK